MDKMTMDKMTVDKMTMDKMTVDKMTVDKIQVKIARVFWGQGGQNAGLTKSLKNIM